MINIKEAYDKALSDGYDSVLEDICCTEPYWAYRFAFSIKGADIERCQEAACKEAGWAFKFALNVEGANIEKCQEEACKEASWAYMFAFYIKGADIEKIRKLCPEISDKVDELLMDRALK